MRQELLTTLLVALVAAGVRADSLMPLGAEGITQADISVVIGGGLGREAPTRFELFAGDVVRAGRFELALRKTLAARLQTSGIPVVAGSKSGFGVAIYGRPVDAEDVRGKYAVLIEFSVTNEKYPQASQPVAQRSVLETPTNQRLETDIQSRVLALLDEALTTARAHAK